MLSISNGASVRKELQMLGNAIVDMLGVAVVLGIENRTPMPTGEFVVMTPIREERQATNETYYPTRTTGTNECDRADLIFSTLVIQLDSYGTNAGQTANGLMMLMRSDIMERYGITPLFSSDPINAPYIDGEMQNKQRYTLDSSFQFNVAWQQPQDSAITISIDKFYEADHL